MLFFCIYEELLEEEPFQQYYSFFVSEMNLCIILMRILIYGDIILLFSNLWYWLSIYRMKYNRSYCHVFHVWRKWCTKSCKICNECARLVAYWKILVLPWWNWDIGMLGKCWNPCFSIILLLNRFKACVLYWNAVLLCGVHQMSTMKG
jgi:hypothetical protein